VKKKQSRDAGNGTLNPIVLRFQWHFRHDGGLFIGFRWSFPTLILFDNGETRPTMDFTFGFLVFSIEIEIRGKPFCKGKKL
jgi:hypothetical protein